MSKGYREFKGPDDVCHNDVVALVFMPLGECKQDNRRGTSSSRGCLQSSEINAAAGGESIEIATFYVDSHWSGIPTDHIVESIDVQGLTRVPGLAQPQLFSIVP